MVNNYGCSFVLGLLGVFLRITFLWAKIRPCHRVCVATSLLSSVKPVFKLIDTAERMLAQSQIS